jgi:hypothetical protein
MVCVVPARRSVPDEFPAGLGDRSGGACGEEPEEEGIAYDGDEEHCDLL